MNSSLYFCRPFARTVVVVGVESVDASEISFKLIHILNDLVTFDFECLILILLIAEQCFAFVLVHRTEICFV